MAVTFDGPNLLVVLDAVSVEYTAQQIYSAWKDWVLSGNAQWPPAFRTTGGDLYSGSKTPHFYYVRNDLGWRIKKPESTIVARVDGNIVFEDPNASRFVEPDGDFTPTVEIYLTNISTLDVNSMLQAIAAAGLNENQAEWLRRLYIAHYHKRTLNNERTKLYDSDGTTPLFDFEHSETRIEPQFNPEVGS